MTKKPNKSDLKRIVWFETIVKNINSMLKGKSVDEINDFFDIQDKILKHISVAETRELLLNQSKLLRTTATEMINKFHSIIKRIQNSPKKLEWKSIGEITLFFDEIDKDISTIPDMRMRQLLMQQCKNSKEKTLNYAPIDSIVTALNQVTKDYSLAWKTVKEINQYFDNIDTEIDKLPDSTLKDSLSLHSGGLRDMILFDLEMNEKISDFDLSFMDSTVQK